MRLLEGTLAVERRGGRVQVALLGGRKPLVVQRHEREAGRRALAARQLAAAVPVGDDEGPLDDRAEGEQLRNLLEPTRAARTRTRVGGCGSGQGGGVCAAAAPRRCAMSPSEHLPCAHS